MNFTCLESEQVELGFGHGKRVTFNNAIAECQAFNATLAVIDSIELYDFAAQLSDEEIVGPQAFWIGFRDVNLNISGNSALRFSPVEGESNKTFFETAKVLPWHQTQPNGNTQNPKQHCVAWKASGTLNGFNASNEWFDATCGSTVTFLCERSCSQEEVIEDVINEQNSEFDAVLYPLMGLAIFTLVTLLVLVLKFKKISSRMALLSEIDGIDQ